ncbi:MAG: GTP 3',8-cyclase MoaA [bacterium]|nr:GTP 3',8-cyclase MoaA [bacterium]
MMDKDKLQLLEDNYHRRIDYLRISITDMCNLRCIYCQPILTTGWKSHQEILRYEEIIRLASLMVNIGIKRIRVTGGEPLIKNGVIHLIEELARVELLEELSLTTNATKLAQFAWPLKQAGVNRVNISLDSLNKEKYAQITGGGNLNNVLTGIEEALRVGLDPLKINVVVMKGINDDELEDFVRLTVDKPLQVRFIEFMPIGNLGISWVERYLPSFLLKERLANYFGLIPTNSLSGNGPAEYYRINGAMGRIGFISPISNYFCSRCNRLRLTPDGHLRLCLGMESELDLKEPLRQGASDDELKELVMQALRTKPTGHQFHLKQPNGRQMAAIGG